MSYTSRSSFAICLLATLIGCSQAQNATEFCSSHPPGLYCPDSLSGYFWCHYNQLGDNIYQQCPAGTECACFVGPSCDRVPTVGSNSPCDFHVNTPLFPPAYTEYAIKNTLVRAPITSDNGTFSVVIYKSANGKERVDTVGETTQYGSSTNTPLSIQEYFFQSGASSYDHYTYNTLTSQCQRTLEDGTIPNSRVPDGYRLLQTVPYSGPAADAQNANVYYFLNGLTYAGAPSGTRDEITVTSNEGYVLPLATFHQDYAFRVNTYINLTASSFVIGEPDSSLFTLPSICSSL